MRKVLFLLVIFSVFSATFAKSDWIPLGNYSEHNAETKIISSTQDETVVKFTVKGYFYDSKKINGKEYSQFNIPGLTTLHKKGDPDFPKFSTSIIVSDNARMDFEIISEKWIDFDYAAPLPSKGALSREIDPSTVPYTFNDVYTNNIEFPKASINLNEPYILRDFRGLAVHFSPFQWQPADGVIRVCEEMVVRVYASDANATNPKIRQRNWNKISSNYNNLYNQHFLNYDLLKEGKYEPLAEDGKLIVIAYDDFLNDVEELVDWKIQKGLTTELIPVSAIGSGSTQIKDYLENEYNSPESFTYVILVGDAQQIPTIYASSPSDASYCLLEGNDYYADAFISRISAQTSADVQNQVAKFVNYEKNPDSGDWYSKGIGIASDESGGTGVTDYDRMELLRDMLLDFTYTQVDQVYDPGASASEVTASINEGRSILNYIGHGSGTSWSTTGFSNSHVGQLSNGNKNPFVLDVSCSNGAFTSGGDCFAEAWLKAGSVESPSGAIAMFSASTSASWVPPCVMQHEAVELLSNGERQSIGGLAFHGVFATMDEYPGSDGIDVVEQYNIFGDCSMIMRTAQSANLLASHMPIIPIGSNEFEVNVNGTANATVALTKDGVIYGVGKTSAGGQVVVQMINPVNQPMDLTLTITAFNKTPYITTIQAIAPEGPWLTVDSYTINDLENGNGNGQWDNGETVNIKLYLKNVGADTAFAPYSVMSSEDELITVIENSSNYSNIDSAGIAENILPLSVSSDLYTPNNHSVNFNVTLTANDSLEWESSFSVPIYAPVINIQQTILNVVGGNGDELLDPGESSKLIFVLENVGGSTIRNVTGTISTEDNYLSILNDASSFGTIFSEGGTVMNSADPFIIKAASNTPAGHSASLMLHLTDENGYQIEKEIFVLIGFPEIMVWDKDGNQNSGDLIYTLLTDSLGKTVDYYTANLPATELNNYKAVFICLGISPNAYKLQESDASLLVDYLEQGGNIYMEGGETWAYDTPTSLHNFFNINGTGDGSGDTETIQGQDGSYAQGLNFEYNGENNYMDRMSPVNPAVSVFINIDPSYTNTVAYDAEVYKTIGSSFEIGGLVDGGDSSTKVFLLEKMLQFFNIGVTEAWICADWIKGDPDNNLQINVLDVVKTVTTILEPADIDTCQQWACDINEDSTVSVLDIVPLINIILGNDKKGLAKENNSIAKQAELYRDDNSLMVNSDGEIAAMQMVIYTENPEMLDINQSDGLIAMELMSSIGQNYIKIIAYSLDGSTIPKASELFVINGDYQLESVILANTLGDKIDVKVEKLAYKFQLDQNYPNPFNPSTVIPFTIGREGIVSVKVYDMLGKEVTTIVNKNYKPGKYSVIWDATGQPSGIYFFKLMSGSRIQTRKMIMLK